MNVKNHADNMQTRQTRQTDELQWMSSQMSHTKQLYKSIAQINHINQSHKMGGCHIQEWKIMDSAFGCSRATQVLMETPETVNITEFHCRYTNK